jgi:predicted ATP-binding protein involved in virulence
MRITKLLLHEVGSFQRLALSFPEGGNVSLADVYLLTGENGAGKSTALYAISALIAKGSSSLGTERLSPRCFSSESVAFLETDQGWIAAVPAKTVSRAMSSDHPCLTLIAKSWKLFGDSDVPDFSLTGSDSQYTNLYFETSWQGNPQERNFFHIAANQLAEMKVLPKPVWAAFTYSGVRTLEKVELQSIKEPTDPPLANILSFDRTAQTKRLIEWISNQYVKRLKAMVRGDRLKQDLYARSITTIEDGIKELTGKDFAFVFSDDDNNIQVRYGGQEMDFDLLPDGLKSIVSWFGDLLMRLDRIPWADEVPPLERSFLLLLDEIDIHLHPAWQRKILPFAQKMFPNAQIIASTHSPFVVASARDAQIFRFNINNGTSELAEQFSDQSGMSYSAILEMVFGIGSEFDIETEQLFAEFHAAKTRLLSGEDRDDTQFKEIAAHLAKQSEEVEALVRIELNQVKRVMAQKSMNPCIVP